MFVSIQTHRRIRRPTHLPAFQSENGNIVDSHMTRLLGNSGHVWVTYENAQGIWGGHWSQKIALASESRTKAEMQIDLL